jgi:hypothetical protein
VLDTLTVLGNDPPGNSSLARLLRAHLQDYRAMHHFGPPPVAGRASIDPGFVIEVQLLEPHVVWSETTRIKWGPRTFRRLEREMADDLASYRAMAKWPNPPSNPGNRRVALLAMADRPYSEVHSTLHAIRAVDVLEVALEVRDPIGVFPPIGNPLTERNWQPLWAFEVTLAAPERVATTVVLDRSGLIVGGAAGEVVFAFSKPMIRGDLPAELATLLSDQLAADAGPLLLSVQRDVAWDVVVGILDATLDGRGRSAFPSTHFDLGHRRVKREPRD